MEVLIRILSSAHRDGIAEDDRFDLMVKGTMEIAGEKVTLEYDEVIEEGGSSQHVSVQIEDDFVTVHRSGDLFMQMAFRMGSRTEGIYQTPMGNMELGTYCTKLVYEFNEYGGSMSLAYQLDMNGQFAAVHEMNFHVVPSDTGKVS